MEIWGYGDVRGRRQRDMPRYAGGKTGVERKKTGNEMSQAKERKKYIMSTTQKFMSEKRA